MAEQTPTYIVGFHFMVEFHAIGGTDDQSEFGQISFQEVSGLSAQLNAMELQEGGENTFTHRLPNPAKYGNLTLKRGMIEDDDLIEWVRDAIENFEFSPKQVFVKLLDANGQPLKTWSFEYAYPVKWNVSNFNSTANALAIETLELTYQKFKVVTK